MPLKIRHHCVSHQRAAAAQLHRHPSHHFPTREAAPRQPAVWAEKLERRRLNRAAFYMQQCFTQQQLCNALHFDSPAPLPRQQQAGQARGNARNPIKQLHSAKGPPSPDPQGPQHTHTHTVSINTLADSSLVTHTTHRPKNGTNLVLRRDRFFACRTPLKPN